MFIKVQNYYEITNAILRLEHVQKPVDVGGLFNHFLFLLFFDYHITVSRWGQMFDFASMPGNCFCNSLNRLIAK